MGKSRSYALFIVEGSTDELALGRILSNLVGMKSGNESKFIVMSGDILTESRLSTVPRGEIAPKNARDKVRAKVLSFISSQRINWTDLSQIVYITDTDGVFIPDDSVVLDESLNRLEYGASEIRCSNPEAICARNHQKASALKALSRVNVLKYNRRAIPFSVYYFSRNLEHALHDRTEEQSTDQKVQLARAFSRTFANDIPGFLGLLADICPEGGHHETWEYIAQGAHSLERGSNLLLAM